MNLKEQKQKRVIVALDVPSLDQARELVEQLADHVAAFKVGLQLLFAAGPKPVIEFMASLGGLCFVDAKLKDIPETVYRAAQEICLPGTWMFNLHIDGGEKMIKEALRARDESGFSPLVMGVTVLTSLNYEPLRQMGILPPLLRPEEDRQGPARLLRNLVVQQAYYGQQAGLDGVIASAQEAPMIRNACGSDFLIATPGIRPLWAAKNDQDRVTTPGQAIQNGADYVIIGRPITQPPESIKSPVAAIQLINEEIAQALVTRR